MIFLTKTPDELKMITKNIAIQYLKFVSVIWKEITDEYYSVVGPQV